MASAKARPGFIGRAELQEMEFTVALVTDQSKPWWLSEFVSEPQPPGFFAELAPAIAPFWSDHELVGLDAIATAADGTRLSAEATLRKRDERGHLVLFFPNQEARSLPVGSKVRFVAQPRASDDDA